MALSARTHALVYPRRGEGIDSGIAYTLGSMLRTQHPHFFDAAALAELAQNPGGGRVSLEVLVPRRFVTRQNVSDAAEKKLMTMPLPLPSSAAIDSGEAALDFAEVCARFYAKRATSGSDLWQCSASSCGVIVGVILSVCPPPPAADQEAEPARRAELVWELSSTLLQCLTIAQLAPFAKSATAVGVTLVPPHVAGQSRPSSIGSLLALAPGEPGQGAEHLSVAGDAVAQGVLRLMVVSVSAKSGMPLPSCEVDVRVAPPATSPGDVGDVEGETTNAKMVASNVFSNQKALPRIAFSWAPGWSPPQTVVTRRPPEGDPAESERRCERGEAEKCSDGGNSSGNHSDGDSSFGSDADDNETGGVGGALPTNKKLGTYAAFDALKSVVIPWDHAILELQRAGSMLFLSIPSPDAPTPPEGKLSVQPRLRFVVLGMEWIDQHQQT